MRKILSVKLSRSAHFFFFYTLNKVIMPSLKLIITKETIMGSYG